MRIFLSLAIFMTFALTVFGIKSLSEIDQETEQQKQFKSLSIKQSAKEAQDRKDKLAKEEQDRIDKLAREAKAQKEQADWDAKQAAKEAQYKAEKLAKDAEAKREKEERKAQQERDRIDRLAREAKAQKEREEREARREAKEEQERLRREAKEEQERKDRLAKEEQDRKDRIEREKREALALAASRKAEQQRRYLEWAREKMEKAGEIYTECENTKWTSWGNKDIQAKLKVAWTEIRDIHPDDISAVHPADSVRFQQLKEKIDSKYKPAAAEKSSFSYTRLETFPTD